MIKTTGFAIPCFMDSENSFSEISQQAARFFCENIPQKKTQHPVGFLECIDPFPL